MSETRRMQVAPHIVARSVWEILIAGQAQEGEYWLEALENYVNIVTRYTYQTGKVARPKSLADFMEVCRTVSDAQGGYF